MTDSSAPLRPAKITDRFLAYLVDAAPFLSGYYGTLWVMVVQLGKWPASEASNRRAALAWLGLYLAYQVLGNLSGATLGKRLFGIVVVAKDGGRLGFFRSVVRAFGYFLSTPLCNLGFLWSLVDARSRTWHDLLAGSLVVERAPKSAGSGTLIAVTSFVAVGVLVASNAYFTVFRPTPSDLAAVRKAEDGLGILAEIEESYKARRGFYTSDLAELARESGDVGEFRRSMEKIFDPDGFVLIADENGYELEARAKDRRRTAVRLRGPSR